MRDYKEGWPLKKWYFIIFIILVAGFNNCSKFQTLISEYSSWLQTEWMMNHPPQAFDYAGATNSKYSTGSDAETPYEFRPCS